MNRRHRTAWQISCDVWRALLLRESVSRLFDSRTAWLWLFLEPLFHMAYLVFIFTAIRVNTVGGTHTAVWILMGLLAYFYFNRTSNQLASGINAHRALFAYRQIKPIDPLLVRAVLEAVLLLVVSVVMFAGLSVFIEMSWPSDPLGVLIAWCAAWVLGVAWGLLLSVATELLPDLGRVLMLFQMPLYFLSGVMFPIASAPAWIQEVLLLNPLVHCIEQARLGLNDNYHAVAGLDPAYPWAVAICLGLLGLALQRVYAHKLVAV